MCPSGINQALAKIVADRFSICRQVVVTLSATAEQNHHQTLHSIMGRASRVIRKVSRCFLGLASWKRLALKWLLAGLVICLWPTPFAKMQSEFLVLAAHLLSACQGCSERVILGIRGPQAPVGFGSSFLALNFALLLINFIRLVLSLSSNSCHLHFPGHHDLEVSSWRLVQEPMYGLDGECSPHGLNRFLVWQ